MTNEQLKNRTQQTIDAIPVLREKEYGWAEIEKMLNEILIELDDIPSMHGTEGKSAEIKGKLPLMDEIAIFALNGMLAHSTRYRPRPDAPTDWHQAIAEEAYELADAMLEVRRRDDHTYPSPWHTGTPTEEGWYLLKVKSDDEVIYDTNRLIQCLWGLDWKYVHEEILAWQKIEEY